MDHSAIEKVVKLALDEDLISGYDVTTDSIIPPGLSRSFTVNAGVETILCVEPLAKVMLGGAGVEYCLFKSDGSYIFKDECIIYGFGDARTLLKLERTFLNFIQRSCAVAAITRQFVDAVSHTGVKICGTRKTTPNMRCLEKYAVEVGGGEVYRDSLSENVLIKDNHIAICGGITFAIENLKNALGESTYVMVECDTFAQVEEAVSAHVNSILLDNMSIEEIEYCVRHVRNLSPKITIDASGGVTLATVREIAETGVDSISIGTLTHSITSADIGIDIA